MGSKTPHIVIIEPMRRPHFALILILAVLVISGCAVPAAGEAQSTVQPSLSLTAAPTGTPTSTRTASPSSTVRPTRTASASPASSRTATPTPELPEKAVIEEIFGYGQLFPLSCEARSAADWARHFGVKIREMEFLARLPHTDNPEMGFVGSIKGSWGNVPPKDYGVHAVPIAKVLKTFGAQAQAVRNMTYDQLRGEIAAGRPVIVWVTGHVAPGKGEEYIVDDQVVTVARYEHTVIAIGYDKKYVTFLDGNKTYRKPVQTFLDAWSPLENMAIMWVEEPPKEP